MERVRRAVAVEIENSPPEFYAVEEQNRRIVEEVTALAQAVPVTPSEEARRRTALRDWEGVRTTAASSLGRRSQKSSLWGSLLENLVKAVLANATR
jgi:hypothetical protein